MTSVKLSSNSLSIDYSKSHLATHPRRHLAESLDSLKLENVQSSDEREKALFILYSVLPNIKLSNLQTSIFLEAWQGRTYQKISELTSYDHNYLKDTGHKLWKTLSENLNENVTKNNFRSVLQRCFQNKYKPQVISDSIIKSAIMSKHTLEEELVYDLREAVVSPRWIGYSSELEQLKKLISENRYQLFGLFGIGGVGKSSLAVQITEQVRNNFDYIIWKSLRNAPSFETLAAGLINQLSDQLNDTSDKTVEELVSLLLTCLHRKRCLLVLDDWHSVLRSPGLTGLYQENCEFYGLLLRRVIESENQSCLLIISREEPSGIAFKDPTLPAYSLYLRGLESQVSRELLLKIGLIESKNSETFNYLTKLYSGNPYALKAAARTILNLFGGSTSQFLKQNELIYGEIQTLLEKQFNRLSELEKLILFGMANNDSWIEVDNLAQSFLLARYDGLLLEAVESLYHRSFIEKHGGFIRQPQILRQYLMSQNKRGTLPKIVLHLE